MESEKEKLYKRIDSLRRYFSIDPSTTVLEILKNYNCYNIEYAKFNNPGLCAIAMVGEKVDTIVLNSKRTSQEQNFDCGHELIHLCLHRNEAESFNCFNRCLPQQNSFIEWQANEGAAQLLVPYQDFIPKFFDLLYNRPNYDLVDYLAWHYFVPERVIQYRIANLSFELDQYGRGVPIDKLRHLSNRQLKNMQIKTTRYDALIAFGTI